MRCGSRRCRAHGRSVNSGNYSNDAATIWNGVSTPMIITGGYPLRSSRMGFTTGTTIPDTTGDITLYIDGELITSTPLSPTNMLSGLSTNYAYLAKGGYTSDLEWIGTVHEFNIYNVAPKAREVKALFEEGL